MATFSSNIASALDGQASSGQASSSQASSSYASSSYASSRYARPGGWLYPAAVLCAIVLLLVGF